METLLQTIGVAALVGVIVLLVVVLVVVYKIRQFFRKLKDAAGQCGTTSPPAEIHLVRAEAAAEFNWEDEEQMAEQTAAIQALGYSLIGSYTVEEKPQIQLRGFNNARDSAVAVLYERMDSDEPSYVIDFVSRYDEGEATKSITYCNSPMAGIVDKQEAHVTVRKAGANAADLHRAFIEGRPAGRLQPAIPAEFVQRFEAAYANEMAWRKNKGGASRDEIRRVAQATNKNVTDAQVESAYRTLQQRDSE